MFFAVDRLHSIRFKLIASLIIASLLVCVVSIFVGGNMLYRSVLDEARNRIRQDLNVARVLYDDRINTIRTALELTASMPEVFSGFCSPESPLPETAFMQLTTHQGLDFLGVTDAQGQVVYRQEGNRSGSPGSSKSYPLVEKVLKEKQTFAGTVVLSEDELLFVAPSLVDRVRVSHAVPKGGRLFTTQAAAMTIGVAVPIFLDGSFAGILYGGMLLNQETGLVDKIGETVFKNEIYKGQNVGTATIFLDNLRIATSVKDASGKRALGTRASPEVARRVLGEGGSWTGRARVLDNWYVTAYEPLLDISGKRVGMLYVGVLEAQYADVRARAIAKFASIILVGVLVAIILGWMITGRIMQPVTHLIRASAEISSGNLSPDIGPISKDDIGRLQRNFLTMTDALREKEERKRVEHETRLLQSEKQASIGKLAAGVAHEINNPLTAVLTFTHLILRRKDLPEEVREDLEMVADQTERVRNIVKSLLDFSRQSEIEVESIDINGLIRDCVELMKNQALIKDIELSFKGQEKLAPLRLDRNRIQSVMINLIINALDATAAGGSIKIVTARSVEGCKKGVSIAVEDTGHGISPEDMEHLFDPFFSTKEVGKGTGLGLAVTAGIVERHGGSIKVRSRKNEGTTFTLWIPYQDGPEDFQPRTGEYKL